jgi:hypothetical protein
MSRTAVAHVESVRIAKDDVVLLQRVRGEGPVHALAAADPAELEAVEPFRIELRQGLLALQPIELGHLGRAESAARGGIQALSIRHRVSDIDLGREVRELVLA